MLYAYVIVLFCLVVLECPLFIFLNSIGRSTFCVTRVLIVAAGCYIESIVCAFRCSLIKAL